MQIPEGVQTVTAEGRDLVSALNAAAQELGVELARVGHKLDLSHFRSGAGTSVPRTTVRIIAWESADPIKAPLGLQPSADGAEVRTDGEERPERRERRDRGDRGDRDRGERRERSDRKREPRRRRDDEEKPADLRAPEPTTTEASAFAETWFSELLGHMGVEGTVTGTGNAERIHLEVRADKAGRIIGKRGATLGAIRHLLGLAVERKFGQLVIDVDVDDHRSEDEKRSTAERGDDEGDRKRRRRKKGGRRDEEPRGRGGDKGGFPEAKLKALARRAAEKAKETGQTITINLELNSYDRRVLHVEISEVDGVESQSEEREVDGRTVKYVQVIPQS